jgi:hypothetical protein
MTVTGTMIVSTGTARRAFDRLTGESNDPALIALHRGHLSITGSASLSMTYLRAPDGAMQIEWCDDCRYLRVFCEHEHCSWDASGICLICDLCREDLS